jgi:hypothetical protein
MDWTTFSAIFSQKHLVTLFRSESSEKSDSDADDDDEEEEASRTETSRTPIHFRSLLKAPLPEMGSDPSGDFYTQLLELKRANMENLQKVTLSYI